MVLLSILCFLLFLLLIVLSIVHLFKKTGKAKRMFLSSIGSLVICIALVVSNALTLVSSPLDATQQNGQLEPPKKEIVENPSTINLSEFNRLKMGISYDQATDIIGGYGEVLSEGETEGTPFHTIIYQYEGEGSLGANANLMFQGGKLTNKAQYGLK